MEQREDPATVQRDFVIGPYSIQHKIGQGIFAKVKLAVDASQRKVAVKIFDKNRFKRRHALLQVEKEINAIRIADHPHIVNYVEILETHKRVFLVMQHVAGGELYDYIQESGKLPEREAARLFYQIVSAVKHCHDKGIIHRDLKPENILLDSDKNAKIVDFGLCTHVPMNQFTNESEKSEETILTTQCGSPHYAAPEILNARSYYGPHVDVWSLGVILFAMLCGKLPFNARDITILHRLITAGRYVIPAYVSDAAGELIFRILKLKPSDRPSAAEILEDPWFDLVDQKTKDFCDSKAQAPSKDEEKKDEYFNIQTEKTAEEEKEVKDRDDFVARFVEAYFVMAPSEVQRPRTAEFKRLKRAFLRAAETGDEKTVREYCDANNDISVNGIDNWTALHYAARKGHHSIIQILLTSFQPLNIDIRTRNAWTPLMLASDRGHLDCARVLLEYGADPHLVNQNDKSCIFLSRESKHWDIAQMITEHSSRAAFKQRGRQRGGDNTLSEELMKVCESGDVKGLDHIIALNSTASENDQEPVVNMKAVGCDNWTALHMAARKGHTEIITRLLPFYAGDVDIATKTRWTALMMASDRGHTEVVRLLLGAGADPLLASAQNNTAVSLATESRHPAILGLIQHTLTARGQENVDVLERVKTQQ